jgi:hypothetical protein
MAVITMDACFNMTTLAGYLRDITLAMREAVTREESATNSDDD